MSVKVVELGTAKRILAREGGDLTGAMASRAFRADVGRALRPDIVRLEDGIRDALEALEGSGSGTARCDQAAAVLRDLCGGDA